MGFWEGPKGFWSRMGSMAGHEVKCWYPPVIKPGWGIHKLNWQTYLYISIYIYIYVRKSQNCLGDLPANQVTKNQPVPDPATCQRDPDRIRFFPQKNLARLRMSQNCQKDTLW